MNTDAAVVGAGIVGASCALELARGGLRVFVLDLDRPGGGATAAGMGHVVVMDDSDAQFELSRWSRELWSEVADDLPAEAEADRCGTIWVAEDAVDFVTAEAKHAWYAARGVRTEVLDGRALREAEPALAEGLAGGLFVPDDIVVYAPCVVDWLLARAADRGAVVRRVGVEHLGPGTVTLADGSSLRVPVIVDAAGDRALDLLAEPAAGVTIKPRKGHLVITDRYPGYCHHQLVELGYLKSAHGSVEDSVAFNLQPRKTGQMLLGSSRQFGREDSAVEPDIVARMIGRASDFLSHIGELEAIRCWAGFRAATADHLPLIGAVPGQDGVWLAAGHEGLGITTSLGTGRLIADLVLGRAPAIDPGPYAVARFAEGSSV